MNFIINKYLEEMKQTKSDSTVKNHTSTLNKFVAFTGVNEPIEVLPEDVMSFKKHLLQNGTSASANTQMKRVKAFFKWCVAENIMQFSPAEDIKLVTEAEALPKWLNKDQKGVLLRAIKRDFLGEAVAEKKKSYRELLLVLLMLKCGLRVGELVNLKLKDVTVTDRKGSLYIRADKNGIHRTVPMTSDVLKIFKLYLDHHKPAGEYVFFTRQSPKMSERTVQTLLNRYVGLKTETATIEELTPHMLRHTFAHDLALGNMAIESIARLMGHFKKNGQPNIQQTIRYTMKSTGEIFDEVEDILGLN